MKTRNGKIARLSKHLREEINRRLQNGEPAESILRWLNKQPECRKVMAELFDGRPISKHNLSEWKQGGYEDWLRKEECVVRVRAMMEQAEELEGQDEGEDGNEGEVPNIAGRLAAVLEMQLAEVTSQLDEIADPEQRWKRTREILRELDRLRRGDHHAQRVALAQQKWDDERDQKEEEADREQKQAEKKWLLDTFEAHRRLPLMANLMGGGNYGAKWAIWEMCVKQDLPMPAWWDPKRPRFEIPPNDKEEGRRKNAESSKEQGGVKEVPSSQHPKSREDSNSNIERHDRKNWSVGKAKPGGENIESRSDGTTQTQHRTPNAEHRTNARRQGKSESVVVSSSELESEQGSKVQSPTSKVECDKQGETIEERLASESGLPSAAEMTEYFTRKKKEAELRGSQ